MARPLKARLSIVGNLEALTPLHVGGLGEDVDTDLPLARDGRGRLYVPGTSLAGPLREWCRRAFGDVLVDHAWGFQRDDNGHASHVLVEDAAIGDSERWPIEVRDGVGIDRRAGVAADRIKFDRAILPIGTRLPLEITVEIPIPAKKEEDREGKLLAMFGHLVEALKASEVRLGAARSRGLGRVRLLEDVKLARRTLNTPDGMLDLLRNLKNAKGNSTSEDWKRSDTGTKPSPRPRLTIEVAWHPVGPLMVKAGYDGEGVDMLPLVTGEGDRVAPVLPGSSIKGALRARAERIVRTMIGCNAIEAGAEFEDQINVPLVDALFGSPGLSKAMSSRKSAWYPGLSAVTIDDCLATTRIDRDRWEEIASASGDPSPGADKSPLRQKLDDSSLGAWKPTTHVAIDRWTGGAADSFLFGVLEPHDQAWGPLVLQLDFERIGGDERAPALMLLLLVLRDLAKGSLPLGFGTNRGLGSVVVDSIHLHGTDLDKLGLDLPATWDQALGGGSMTGLDSGLRDRLKTHWGTWINRREHRE